MVDDIFTTLASRSAALAVPEEGDFLRDGLLHCGKCGKPKQCRVMLHGTAKTPQVVGCCCDCTNEAYLRGKEERGREEKRLRIEALEKELLEKCNAIGDLNEELVGRRWVGV